MIKLKQRAPFRFRQGKYPQQQPSSSRDDVESGRSSPSEWIDGSCKFSHRVEVDTVRTEKNVEEHVLQYKVISSLVILCAIPFFVFERSQQSGTSNLYRFVCHFDIVWKSLLQVSIWPIMTGTFFVAITSRQGTSMASNWKKIASIVAIAATLVLTNVIAQGIYPHTMWNPFMWGRYRVYLPNNIETSFKGACFDFKKHGRNKTPLCLSEENWNELSSGKLSSTNMDDVNQVLDGLDYLKNTSRGIIIAALARNIADSIPSLRQNMEGLAPLFKHSNNKLTLAIYENDSNDGTREAFQRWSDEVSIREDSHYTIDLMSCGLSSPDCKLGFADRYDTFTISNSRAPGVGKLGKLRQILLEYILSKDEYNNYSHMIVLDADLETSISPLGLLHTLGLNNGIAQDYAVASSSSQVWIGGMGSIIPPYDLSAFRPPKSRRNNNIVEKMHQWFCRLNPSYDRWRNMCDAASPFQLFMIQSANDWSNHEGFPYEVVSAFNGLTIYPMRLLRESDQAQYITGEYGQVCEHVGLHLSLKQHMYVNPKWSMNLKPSKPGGPTGLQALKVITSIMLGHPIITLSIFVLHTCLNLIVVSTSWIISIWIKAWFGELCVLQKSVKSHSF